MGDSDQNPNGSYTEISLNSTFSLISTFTCSLRKRKEDPKLKSAKEQNKKLACLHQRTKLFLTKLEKCEDHQIDSKIAKIEQRVSELAEPDYAFYRLQSREMLLQMLDTAQAAETQMYEDLEDVRYLILDRLSHKPIDADRSDESDLVSS